jgi:hypothetical protein
MVHFSSIDWGRSGRPLGRKHLPGRNRSPFPGGAKEPEGGVRGKTLTGEGKDGTGEVGILVEERERENGRAVSLSGLLFGGQAAVEESRGF